MEIKLPLYLDDWFVLLVGRRLAHVTLAMRERLQSHVLTVLCVYDESRVVCRESL